MREELIIRAQGRAQLRTAPDWLTAICQREHKTYLSTFVSRLSSEIRKYSVLNLLYFSSHLKIRKVKLRENICNIYSITVIVLY